MSLNTPQEILDEVSAVRAHLIREMKKAASGPRHGRLPPGIRSPQTIEEGLAYLQGQVVPLTDHTCLWLPKSGTDPFLLPPLDYYFAAMLCAGLDVPDCKEPESLLESLKAINEIIACCRNAIEANMDYVTLDKAAAIVNKSKRTLEKLKTRARDPLPPPDAEGGGGKADEWKWSTLKPWLEIEYGRKLPDTFPTLRKIR